METVISQALLYACECHRDDRRKDSAQSPYINHPVTVMHILNVEGGITDPDVLATALLHDVLEDTDATYDDLVARFGTAIADAVVELTDDQDLPRADRYIEQQNKVPHYSHIAKLVRLADRIANFRDILDNRPPSWPIERVIGHATQAHTIVNLLRGTHPQLEALFDTLYTSFDIESL